MAEKYTGPERREYCEQHCQLNELAKKSVPWRFFVGTMSSLLLIAIAYATINETRLGGISADYQKSVDQLTAALDKRMLDQQVRYSEDVRRFYQVAERNSDILIELKTNMADSRAKQELILKKIKIAE